MDNYDTLRRIATIADEVFSIGGSQIKALEKIRLIATQSIQEMDKQLTCNCSNPAPIGIAFKCRQCQLPITRHS